MTRFNTEYAVKGNPLYGVQVSLGWRGILREGDEDRDGIIDKKDACPRDAEDRDDFSDNDGCPDPDNDGDGFIDEQDRCPDVAGPDGGCPVADRTKTAYPTTRTPARTVPKISTAFWTMTAVLTMTVSRYRQRR
jgi:hypothetical protein